LSSFKNTHVTGSYFVTTMFKIFRRKSVRRSKDFHKEDHGEEEVGHYNSRSNPRSDSYFNSLDRRSQCSGSHRYSSYSTNTLGSGRESPPEIVQYLRPPENLTSPNRESSSVLQKSELVVQSPRGRDNHQVALPLSK